MPEQYPPVSVMFTEQRKIRSAIVGEEYLIRVRLPEDFAVEPEKRYPVLYLTDGDHAFAMATDIVQYLIYGGHVPDMIIASPAYGSKVLGKDGGLNMRERDLAPFVTKWTKQPGGDKFLQFFEQELMPFVEMNYRADPSDRILWGYSAGSYFVLYAIFQNPKLFHRYIAIDGVSQHHFKLEEAYSREHRDLPAKLFLGAGDYPESPVFTQTLQFVEQIKQREYTGFKLEYAPLNNIGHFAIPAEGLVKGLVSVFRE